MPGTLLNSETTFTLPEAGGIDQAPDIWGDKQSLERWKQAHVNIPPPLFPSPKFHRITVLNTNGEGFSYVAVLDVPSTGRSRAPRPLTVDEIKEYSRIYAQRTRTSWISLLATGQIPGQMNMEGVSRT
ncbi:uncharacterized protein ARMOST_14949 [Armillaria ostoyae]|uniref:Uncharacterized protein n=1 Tax=Armillaria ostoyae TaxID=47428 RepID=A0A284RS66_ARMOS|nr:uncharacterized protein ARMOST_14949 [Armillaria ostoyae]